ncbi:MAG: hypothetical protein KC503_43190 [Myxococcales bacterium]|nr:hypothetical protein [Myxococcales bacterium]
MTKKAHRTAFTIAIIPTLALLGCEPELQRERVLQLEDAKTRASACSCGGGGKWSGGGNRWGNGLRNFGRGFGGGGFGNGFGGGPNWGNGGGWGNGLGNGGGGGGGWMNFWQGLLGGLGNSGGGLPGGQPPANDYVPPPTTTPPASTPINNPTNPPNVSILYPKPVSEVSGDFKLSADIKHDRGIASVEIRVDGNVVGGGASQPYEYALTLPAGPHNAEVRVFDVSGLSAAATVQFTVVGAGGSSSSNTPNATGVTSPGAPTTGMSVFGALCELDIDCQSGFCVNDPAITGGPRYCSQPCDLGCPVGSVCLQSNKGVGLCGIALPGSGGNVGSTNVSGGGALPQSTDNSGSGTTRSIAAGCQIGASTSPADDARTVGGALLLLLFVVLRRKTRC